MIPKEIIMIQDKIRKNELQRLRYLRQRTVKPQLYGLCVFCKTVTVGLKGEKVLYCSAECSNAVRKIRDAIRSCYSFMKTTQERQLQLFDKLGVDYTFLPPNEIYNKYFGLNVYKSRNVSTKWGEK